MRNIASLIESLGCAWEFLLWFPPKTFRLPQHQGCVVGMEAGEAIEAEPHHQSPSKSVIAV